MSRLGSILSAAAYSVCQRAASPAEPKLAAPYNDAACFLRGQVERMPGFSRAGVVALAWLFDLSAWPRFGRTFHRLRHEQRLDRLEAWRRSPVPFFRLFVSLIESLSVYCLYARLEDGAPWERPCR